MLGDDSIPQSFCLCKNEARLFIMTAADFEQFFHLHKNRLYNYILRFVDIDDDVQDLMQEVCLAFYQRIERIDEKTALAYLYRIAHNKAINWQKKIRKTVLRSNHDFDRIPAGKGVDNSQDIVNKAIAFLPVNLGTVIHLYYFDKLSYQEIGMQLGKSVKSVDSLLTRARKKLRKHLEISVDGTMRIKK